MSEEVRIIYIEDELRDVELVQAQLRRENYPFELKHVENKAELLTELGKNHYDVILMDYSLPSFDPLTTIRELRNKYPTIPVIIISGTIGEELAIETLKSGAIDYVLKHRLVRLRPAIERAVQLAQERKERIRAQNELRKSEEKFRLLAENATDMISTHTNSGIYGYVSPSAYEIVGYDPEELIGKSCFDFIHPDDVNVVKELHKRIDKEGTAPAVEYRYRCKNGAYKWVETKARKISVNGGTKEAGVLSVTRDISERKEFEEQLKASLQEKVVLLSEIHHRVKNNLQVISSLLNLQAARIESDEAKDAFKKSVYRIRTLATIHETLYKSDNIAAIDFIKYATGLARNLFLAYHNPHCRISLVTEGENTKLAVDKAIPCALLLNEIITNSLKYAFKGREKGTIYISFEDLGESFRLTAADDGIGLPEDFPNEESMGSKLIRALTDQLEGELEIERSGGSKFILTFPKKLPGEK